jgi:serralysin
LDGTRVIGRIDGGGGFDMVSYANSIDFVNVFLNPDSAQFNQRDAAHDTYLSIEGIIGSNFNDVLVGHTGNDRIDGGSGADLIEGHGGNDLLIGGEGNDTLDGGAGADTLVGGAGNNTLRNVDSADTVINPLGTGTQKIEVMGSYGLSGSVQVDVLQAGAEAGAIKLTGNGFKNTIIGNAAKNTLKGQGGNDTLYGGRGEDALTGGKGKDVFVFDTKAGKGNRDVISDFDVKDDSIWLDNAVFTKLGKHGSEAKPAKLNKHFFVIGDEAQDNNDYLIYDKATGKLLYDADGSGSRAAVEIATLTKDLALTYRDFFVI